MPIVTFSYLIVTFWNP